MERHPAAEPISPELVLVDPDLAVGARRALPDRPWPAPVRIEPAPRRARDGGLVAALLWPVLVGLGLTVVIFGLSLISTQDRPTFAADGTPVPPTPLPAASPPPAPPDDEGQPSAPPPAAPTTTTQARSPQAAPTPRRRPAQQKFSPARLFSWAPHARTAYYQVLFLRNGRPLYRTRARGPRLELPNRVRFAAGRYRWTVRPAIRTRRGVRLSSPIVDSTFKISGD